MYGLPVADAESAHLVRRVVIISTLSALVVVALTVLNFTIFREGTTVGQTIVSCIIGLCLPVVGWLGSKTNNRPALGLFCSFSFGCGLFNLVSYILLMVSASLFDKYLDQCDPDGTVVINGKVYTGICGYTHEYIRNIYIVASCITLPIILLQCLGGIFGSKLYNKLQPGVIITYLSEPCTGGYKANAQAAPTVTAFEVRNLPPDA